MEEALVYQPEYNLLRDAYLGNKEMLQSKLNYLANIAQEEQWDYHGTTDKPILYNYLCYTYDRIKTENKIEVTDDGSAMCFNTGLLTEHGADIYAYFVKNENQNKKSGQDWFLYGFKQRANVEMRAFRKYPDIADYFTTPADFIYDKSLELSINYEHIIDDNYDRFTSIGLTDKYMINGLLENAVKRIIEKVKRNYRIARKTAANLDAQHSCLRIKLSVGCKRRFYFSYICQSFHISVCDIQYVETPHTP